MTLSTDRCRSCWCVGMCTAWMLSAGACSIGDSGKNSLYQQTGQEGSTIPKQHAPYYPNTAGNIVAPPGNPGGNPAGAPPIVGGNLNHAGVFPDGR